MPPRGCWAQGGHHCSDHQGLLPAEAISAAATGQGDVQRAVPDGVATRPGVTLRCVTLPPFHMLYGPLLSAISDGAEHSVDEAAAELTKKLEIAPEDAARRTKQGGHTLFENRVAWAKSYLSKAGLVRLTGPETMQITDDGRTALRDGPADINDVYLRSAFPRFAQWTDEAAGRPVDDEIDPDDPNQAASSLWLLRAGEKGRFANHFLEHGVLCLGFGDTGSVHALPRDKVVEAVKRALPGASGNAQGQAVNSLMRFADVMREGDLVVTPEPRTRTVLFGEVAGAYEYAEEALVGKPC
jgi:hypothetical protein